MDDVSASDVSGSPDDSVKKVVWQAIQSASQKWTMQLKVWCMAMSRFIIGSGDHLDDHF